MAQTLADAYVRMRPETKEFSADTKRELQGPAEDAGKSTGSHFGSAFTSAVRVAVVGAAALFGVAAAGIKKAVSAASDLAETQSKVNVVFGKGSQSIIAFADDAARNLGQSAQTALDGAAAFATYGKAAGKSGEDLVQFSTRMTTLASDVGSFTNTDPSQVIEDFGSALRGEFDPVEKYGILINDDALRQEALRLHITKTTKEALTPQQRVLAVQSLLFKQTSDAQGDFARTSGGLANQQRILKANFDNISATIGQAFLPIVTKVVKELNDKLIPYLYLVWNTHGPAIIKWLNDAADRFGKWLGTLKVEDIKTFFDNIKDAVEKLTPAIKDLKKESGDDLAATWRVTGIVMKFLADNADILAKALPYLAAGFILAKTAQLASNAAQAAAPFITLLAAAANRRLAASNIELAAAMNAGKVSTVGSTVATEVNTVAENTSILTKIRNVAATVASTVAGVAARAATIAWTAVQWLLNAALSANPIGLVVLAIVALVAAVIIAYKNSETFRDIVQAVWKAIQFAVQWTWENVLKPIFNDFVRILRDYVGPAFVWLYNNVIKPVWGFVSSFIRDNWNGVVKPVFNFLVKMITEDIPNGFNKGVGFIKSAWDKVQEYAKVPVRFVIETVINKGIIGTFNSVAGFLGLSTRINTIGLPAGFASGGFFDGQLPGSPSDVDNMLARGPGGKLVGLASGEYIVNAQDTKRAYPLLEWINSGMQGFAGGGILDFFRSPVGWVTDKLSGPLRSVSERFGDNPMARMVLGLGTKVKDALVDKVKQMLSTFEVLGDSKGSSTGGLAPGITGVLNALRGVFGNVPVISGYRPGSRTLTGNVSYHASGRAIDVAPVLTWARFLNGAFGSRLRELITPWNDLNIHNGRPHQYTGAVWNQHNFAGGNAHIHAAMALGGMLLDNGGAWPSGTIGVNASGRTETVLSGPTMDDLVRLLALILEALQRLAPDLAREMNGATTPLRRISRTGAV